MALPRPHLTPSKTTDPHAISLKVLRLSRPSLSTQTSLPPAHFGHGIDIPPQASRAYPTPPGQELLGSEFPLTPLLTLPAAFGAAFIGETFTCTLCATNEVPEGGAKRASGVRIVADLQTPSQPSGAPLELYSGSEEDDEQDVGEGVDVRSAETLQRTLRYELKEEGPHVLAVTVSYTETAVGSAGGASGGRARTFRKLYQFVAQPLIAVRSKVTERRLGTESKGGRQWVLEAQLENVGEQAVVLESVFLQNKEGIEGKAANGDEGKQAIVLKPQDVEQVMFLLSADGDVEGEADSERIPLAQLVIEWFSAMGERGSLTTGWLASRPR